MVFWTYEKQLTLETLARCGLSSALIAERLGTTRNAIIGRAHRTDVILLSTVARDRKQAMAAFSARVQATQFFPCGHPRIRDNIYAGKLRDGRTYIRCKQCSIMAMANRRKRLAESKS